MKVGTDSLKLVRLPRWESQNGRNFAYTTVDGKGLFIVIAGKNYYFSQKRQKKK